MKASPMVPSEAVLSGQAGQTSGDLPASSHWLPDRFRFQLLSGGSSSELSPHQTKH